MQVNADVWIAASLRISGVNPDSESSINIGGGHTRFDTGFKASLEVHTDAYNGSMATCLVLKACINCSDPVVMIMQDPAMLQKSSLTVKSCCYNNIYCHHQVFSPPCQNMDRPAALNGLHKPAHAPIKARDMCTICIAGINFACYQYVIWPWS